MRLTVTMRVFSIQHNRQGLSEVERIAADIEGMVDRLRDVPGASAERFAPEVHDVIFADGFESSPRRVPNESST